jgi:hypothetical protein
VRFEARDLKSYAEPVDPSRLRVGHVYFAAYYVDDDMLVPVLEPLVYAGRNLEPGDKDNYYFQDFDSYHEGSRYDSPRTGAEPVFHHGDAVKHMFEYEKALDTLLSCSLRRSAKGL